MTSSHDGSLRVWDVERGKQIGEDWREGVEMNTLALSSDGKKVLSGSDDGAVRLWDIDIAKVIAKWTGHTAGVASLCWSRDGQRVVSGSYDGIRVWDTETGKTILGPSEFDFGGVRAVVYSPDETMIAAGGGTRDSEGIGFIKFCDANTGKLVINLGPTRDVHCLWCTSLSHHYFGAVAKLDADEIWCTATAHARVSQESELNLF
jgi:WD40 repeat protein